MDDMWRLHTNIYFESVNIERCVEFECVFLLSFPVTDWKWKIVMRFNSQID